MDGIARLLQDPGVRGWSEVGAFLLLTAPILVTAIWYHRAIRKSPGGRQLMRRQSGGRSFGEGMAMMRDIAAGQYGDYVRRAQTRVYWIAAIWVIANVAVFGVLMWADEVARTTPAP